MNSVNSNTNPCIQCKNCIKETESWEMPHIFWFECKKHSNYSNLTSFPFKNTKCPDFDPTHHKKGLII